MNVTNPNSVIVRGINHEWLAENFTKMWIGFGDAPTAVPKDDAYYVGLYLEAPVSAITHIGIVESIVRQENRADFYLKAIVKLSEPVKPGHQIRKHEYWTLQDFGLTHLSIQHTEIINSKYLSYDAFSTYMLLSDISFERNYIDDEIFYRRLMTLHDLIDPAMKETTERLRARMLAIGGDHIEQPSWIEDKENISVEAEKFKVIEENENESPSVFHLITQKAGIFGKWNFHLTDRDFFPSIPHGHAVQNNRLKLDSYLGHIYKDDSFYARESRQYIIDLWNDESFRKNAIETIKFYMQEYPMFNWRVQDPLRIPKTR